MTIYYKIIMFLIVKLAFMTILLYMFVNLFLINFDDKKNAISYKLYLFLFIFLINFLFQIFANLINNKKITINELFTISINNALISVIAFDVYNDLSYNNFFINLNDHQKILVLILLIIGFIGSIKIVELLINN